MIGLDSVMGRPEAGGGSLVAREAHRPQYRSPTFGDQLAKLLATLILPTVTLHADAVHGKDLPQPCGHPASGIVISGASRFVAPPPPPPRAPHPPPPDPPPLSPPPPPPPAAAS